MRREILFWAHSKIPLLQEALISRTEKLKMLGIEFRFDKKMCPSMESQPSLLLLIDCGERTKK